MRRESRRRKKGKEEKKDTSLFPPHMLQTV